MKNAVARILTKGLVDGYAGDGEIADVTRAGFIGKASHREPESGSVYHDEWFVPTYLGGGQELIKVDGEKFTRVYAGGTPSPEKLAELGITVKDVGTYLKRKISELGKKTRLFENCTPDADGDWRYTYEVVVKEENIGVTVGVESIYCKETRVHIHPFILSPVL